MLFSTVYGPELESLFLYIRKYSQLQGSVSSEQVYSMYLPHKTNPSKGQSKNLGDALNFLKTAGLIGEIDQTSYEVLVGKDSDLSIPFAALLLRQFHKLNQSPLELRSIDLLYIIMLEQLYIKPDCVWISDLHFAANQLELARQIGGISQEKVGAWKRVMEFLGLGYRMGSGFYCLYRLDLLDIISRQWTQSVGSLQRFFEDHLQTWLPCLNARGEISQAVAFSMDQLADEGRFRLLPQQDAPFRAYFGNRCLKGIELL
ncbi:MAG: hypothetical protein HXX20_00065 [Chloroflexi bacterium]|nr:hypothetical protein [Chloroflexota bacterium]